MMYGEYADIVDLVDQNALDEIDHDKTHKVLLQTDTDIDDDGDFDFSLAHDDIQPKKLISPLRETSLSDALLLHDKEPTVLLAGQPPFYVEAVNKSWTSIYGWESDQILGHNLNFLKGDDAKVIDIALMYSVVYTESKRTANIRGYAKDGTLFTAKVTLSPIYDVVASDSNLMRHLSHISVRFSEFKTFNGFLSSDLNDDFAAEVGMPLDRREYSLVAISSLDASAQGHELEYVTSMIRNSSVSGVMKVIATLRIPLAVIVTDNKGKLVHANPEFTSYFGWDLHLVQGRKLDFLFGENTSEDAKRALTEQPKLVESPYDPSIFGTEVSGSIATLYGRNRKPIERRVTYTPIVDLFDELFRPAFFVYCMKNV
jgi:PAS domain S-box-containing protein